MNNGADGGGTRRGDAVVSDGTVSGSATTLTMIPGGCDRAARGSDWSCPAHEDGCRDDGAALDSAIPDYWGQGLDAWFVGDLRRTLPRDIERAMAVRKRVSTHPGETFRSYRVRNHLAVTVPSSDGRRIDRWADVSVRIDERDPVYVLVEGESNPVRALVEDPPSEFWSWFEDRGKARAYRTRCDGDLVEASEGYRPRSEAYNRVAVEGSDGEVVEGVRVSAIVGGQDTYVRKLNDLFRRDPVRFLREFPGNRLTSATAYLTRPPTMFTFLEVVVLADGTTAATVWDASPYPLHLLYVNGYRPRGATNGLERGEGVALDGTVRGGNWVPNQDINLERFVPWVSQCWLPAAFEPFPPRWLGAYELTWDADVPFLTPMERPVIRRGEAGSLASPEAVWRAVDGPLFPWTTD